MPDGDGMIPHASTRRYRSRRTGETVEVVGYDRRMIAGKYSTVYLIRQDGQASEEIQAGTFHRLYERAEEEG